LQDLTTSKLTNNTDKVAFLACRTKLVELLKEEGGIPNPRVWKPEPTQTLGLTSGFQAGGMAWMGLDGFQPS